MSQGGYVTLVGFVAREPHLRQTKDGRNVTDVRVGTTPRVHDKATGEWRDGETSYYTVSCWRRLADNARASLRKGDPVVVKGRFKTHTYEDKTGRIRTEVEITADTVGHDLSRGIANYIRQRPAAPDAADAADGDALQAVGAAGPGAAAAVAARLAAAGEPDAFDPEDDGDMIDGDMIDEDAIERFGRELDAGLDTAGIGVGAPTGEEAPQGAGPS